MGVCSIFDKSIFAEHDNNEKKLPMIDYYIGNKLTLDEVTELENKVIVLMNIEEKDCIDLDVSQWKQPFLYPIGNTRIIECRSSHYLYLGYMYFLAIAWQANVDVIKICSDNTILDSIDLVLTIIGEIYQDVLIKP